MATKKTIHPTKGFNSSALFSFGSTIYAWFKKIVLFFKKWGEGANVLSNISSLIQIVALPLIFFSTCLSYYQLKDYFSEPDLHLEFTNPKALSFYLFNKGDVIAELPIYWFGLIDLNLKEKFDFLPIPAKENSYLKDHGRNGPNSDLIKYLKKGHRYFGFAGISCKNSDKIRYYFLAFSYPDSNNAWYVEVEKQNYPMLFNPNQLLLDPDNYLDKNYPSYKRIYIK